MPNNIYHKRNANPGVAPTAAQLAVGEIALNTADGKAYTRKADGTVVELTEASVADGGEQFTPLDVSNLALWLDASDTSTLYTTDAGPVTAVTAPTDISGCVGWWDASDAASITQSGGLVSQWNDKSGQGNNATTSGTRRPLVVSDALNGKNVISFDGADDLMEASISSGYTAATVFAVLRADAAGGSSLGRAMTRGLSTLFYDGSNAALRYNPPFSGATGNGGQRTANASAALGAWSLASFTWNGGFDVLTSITPRLSGALSSAGLTGTGDSISSAGISTFVIGNRSVADGGDRGWSGPIAELIFFNTALSTADRARVEAYLATKWGISNVHTQATTANTPVGYWADKSGNSRHFSQSIGTSRASIAAAVNGRPVVGFNGASSQLTLSGVTNANLADASGAASFVVFKPDNDSTYSVFHNSLAGTHRDRFGDNSSYPANFRGSRLEAIINGAMPTTATTVLGHSVNVAANTHIVLLNGAAVHSAAQNFSPSGSMWRAQTGVTYRVGNGPNADFLSGVVCEVIQYGAALNDAARQRIERYLAAKWGVTLAPQVSNADAQDWINRVYANGGTVTSSTAAAVNSFCNAIDAAGIRDRFYRLNLFCGDNLTACLVPLYRGPSRTGTQFGNVIDTNNNFIARDYNERGAVGGLTGNGSSKWLNPGTALEIKPSWVTHHFGIDIKNAYPDATSRYQIGAFFNESPTAPRGWYTIYGSSSNRNAHSGLRLRTFTPDTNLKVVMRASTTDMRVFEDAAQVGTTDVVADTATIIPSASFSVMAASYQNVSAGTPTTIVNGYAHAVGIARGYTIGESMNATEYSAFVAAWISFQNLMGRR